MVEGSKLVIEIDLERADLDEKDIDALVEEAKEATGINIEVGRPITEDESRIFRTTSISAEYFTVKEI